MERITNTKYLRGMCVDERLTFPGHSFSVLSKVHYVMSGLTYIVFFFDKEEHFNKQCSLRLPRFLSTQPLKWSFLSFFLRVEE